MMKKLFATTLLAATLVTAGPGMAHTAQSGGGTLTLDLATALEIALSDNPTIRVAEMEVERYDYVRRETAGNLLPQISVNGQYTFNIVKQEMSKGLSLGADMSANGNASLTLPLFAPAVWTTLKMNRTQQTLAVEQARSSRIELVSSVTKAFYQILLLERSHEVLRTSEATMRETVENTRSMFSAGLASEYDLLTAEVQLSNLQPNIINTANSIEIAKQMLRMYLSVPEDVEIAVSGSIDDYRDRMWQVPDPAAAMEGNTELRQMDHQRMLLDQQIRLTQTQRMPTLAAYGTMIASGQDKTIDFGAMMTGGNGTINQWWWQTPFTAGFQVSIPIFSGFKNTSRVKQLRNSIAQIDLQKDYLVEAKQLEARTAVNNVIAAREAMTAGEKTVAQAEKAYTIARTRFDAGAGTMLEVNQAQLNVTQSRLNLSQATYDLLAARADYDKVTGKEN